ncbi:hypothetical protein HDV01_003585 [Terramyces sp. JEL0728]|nr:hypothetical protein HDV01_003585 [Terramyces sp. JEL0728]
MHGIVDFYGLQYNLNAINYTNRRVCTFDNIGFGWSQDSFNKQFTNYEYFYRLLRASGESEPWHIVAWGGGGSAASAIATNHTSSIKSVTYIETYPPGIEFTYWGNSKTSDEVQRYRNEQLQGYVTFANFILKLAIPWGLISRFFSLAPDPSYYPQDKWKEYRVQLWKSKSWITELESIKHLQNTLDANDPLNQYIPLPSSVSVFAVYCSMPISCYSPNDEKSYYNQQKFAMVRAMSSNPKFVNNTDCDCTMSLPVTKPEFTAFSILSLYATINA